MKTLMAVPCILLVATLASADEVLFDSGPQQYAGRNYYWLAQWKLEVTLPGDVGSQDKLEVLFGSKGPEKRTLYFTCDGQTGQMAEVGDDGFAWREVPVGKLQGGGKVLLFGKGRQQVAFLAGVRTVGQVDRQARGPADSDGRGCQYAPRKPLVWADLPGFERSPEQDRLWDPTADAPDWERAERSSRYAGIALGKVQRWLHERCLPVRDEPTGLFRPTGREWNYRDTAADCYPFYVWAAYYTDQEVLETVMIDTLEAEQRLCNHLDRLPVPYDMDAGQKNVIPFDANDLRRQRVRQGRPGSDRRDHRQGLPLVRPHARHRRRHLQACPGRHALRQDPVDEHRGQRRAAADPASSVLHDGRAEVPRLGPPAGRLLPPARRVRAARALGPRLRDHRRPGAAVCRRLEGGPEKCQQYSRTMETMFDEILRRGTNSDGVIIGTLQDRDGPHDNVLTRDGWGYDFVGFLDYDLALGTKRYREAIRRPIQHLLKPRYQQFNWDHGSRDNVADSVEGGLYLLHRIPVPEAFVWADREIATLLVDHTDPDRLWETHKLEANTVRTVLIHTMLHTRNTIARPWRQGLQLGAAPCGDGICVLIKSDQPYEGRLQFDIPRHRLTMGFTRTGRA